MQKPLKTVHYAAIFFFLISLLSCFACRKNQEEAPALILDTDAAEIIETAVIEHNAGIALTAVEAVKAVFSSQQICDEPPQDSSFHLDKTIGVISYKQEAQLSWRFDCINAVPQKAYIGLYGTGNFNAANWSGENEFSDHVYIKGLDLQDTTYNTYCTFTRTGDIKSTSRTIDSTFNVLLTIQMSSLIISKSTFHLVEGAGTISVIATASDGRKNAWTGSITFYDNDNAALLINGRTYNFLLR